MDPADDASVDALAGIARDAARRMRRSFEAMGARGVSVEMPAATGMAQSFADVLGDPSGRLLVTWLPLRGEIAGAVGVVIVPERARRLLETFVDSGGTGGTRLDGQAIGELGMVVGVSMVNALGDATGIALQPAPPEPLVTGLAGLLARAGRGNDGVLPSHTFIRLVDRALRTAGLVILLPGDGALARLTQLAGERNAA